MMVGDKKLEKEKDLSNKSGLLILGELLNTLDGVSSYKDSILFITTNKPEQLDYALKRPGRIDVELEIGLLPPEVIKNRFVSFFCLDHKTVHLSEASRHMSIAEVQNTMVTNKDNMLKSAQLLGLEIIP